MQEAEMTRARTRALVAGCTASVIGGAVALPGVVSAHGRAAAQHVLLLSVDGLHQADLSWYVKQHPSSTLAKLAGGGVEFTGAQTPYPSDSFPGMVGQVTGGNPSSTGIYYDDSWNRTLLPAGTSASDCQSGTVAPGAEVTYFEQADLNQHALDAGQGLPGLPDSILQMTGNPRTLIDPAQLPVDPTTCQPVYPHQYLKVNTVFQVLHDAGMYTAWSDKHAAYEVLSGTSGTGIDDLFTPEINSGAPTTGSSIDWTQDNARTQQYDSYKVQAVLNEIAGRDHSGGAGRPVPALFGMNFQTVSTAEKLPTSNGLAGGYLADGVTPGPLLTRALDYINTKVGAMLQGLNENGLDRSTVVILSAKHGQSPQEPSALTRIPDGPIIDALNAAWHNAHPSAANPLVAFSIDDDGMLIWLNDRSDTATSFARNFLMSYSGTGNDINGSPKPYTQAGNAAIFAGADAAQYLHVAPSDARVPDLIGIAQHGVVYTGGHGKIAEHGGAAPQDRDVPLVVSGAPVQQRGAIDGSVETTQIAPTILQLLGLDPSLLQAVQIEHTQALNLG
jgi:hypothetical protein